MIGKTVLALAIGAVALAAGAYAQRSAMPDGRPAEKFVSEGKYFKCVLPAGWRRLESAGQPASVKKVYGIDVVGPSGSEGPAPSISVKYYARGNTLFKSAAEFVRIHSRPVPGLGLAGEKYSSVASVRLAGRAASRFERKKQVFSGPRRVKNTPVAAFERYLVLPAGEGFYVLNYYSAFSSAKENLPAFDSVVASFEPLLK